MRVQNKEQEHTIQSHSAARALRVSRRFSATRHRGAKVTAIGAISINKVVALMTMDDSMDGKAFEVFVKKVLVPELWTGAVVVMDKLSAHK